MCQAYNKTPSELHNVQGASGLFLDTGIFIFGRWVEGELQEAEASAQNATFARSNKIRTFARCMGDDMSTSTAGFADPFGAGVVKRDAPPKKPWHEEGMESEETLAEEY